MIELGRFGVWDRWFRTAEPGRAGEVAAEVEDLGYGAVWFPAGEAGAWFPRAEAMLGATGRVAVATGIVNVWTNDAAETAAHDAALRAEHPQRFLLGLGVGHAPQDAAYRKPFTAMGEYLDRLDAASPPVPSEGRAIAALWPRMLGLARERSAGSHSYLVTPEHTRQAREALGPDRLLAPEQTVVLETKTGRARVAARAWLALYLRLPNYVDNLLRLGFERQDMTDGGSDRLVDAVVAWGDPQEIRARLEEHLHAGADHVCVQVVRDGDGPPLAQWRALAEALTH